MAPVGTMTHSNAMKIGAIARGNNDIDLFRRPAGLADGLALKEPALRETDRGSPQQIGSPVPRNPSGGSAWPGTVQGPAANATLNARHRRNLRRRPRASSPFRGTITRDSSRIRPQHAAIHRPLACVRVRFPLPPALLLALLALVAAGCGGGDDR